MSPADPRADEVRAEFHRVLDQPGHATDNAHQAMAVVESALAEGVLMRTPDIDQTLADLRLVLEHDDGQKLGGKSAEAARFITRRLGQLIDQA